MEIHSILLKVKIKLILPFAFLINCAVINVMNYLIWNIFQEVNHKTQVTEAFNRIGEAKENIFIVSKEFEQIVANR